MFSSRPHLIWLPDQRLPSWSLSPESILLSFICSTGLQNNQKSHTGVIYSVFTPTRGVADDRKWDEGGQIKKHGEIETTPLWIKYLCLHIFHTCTSVSTECTILWPCNKVIWSLSHTHTHTTLGKEMFSTVKVIFVRIIRPSLQNSFLYGSGDMFHQCFEHLQRWAQTGPSIVTSTPNI